MRCSERVDQGKPKAAGNTVDRRTGHGRILVYFKVQEGTSEDKGT